MDLKYTANQLSCPTNKIKSKFLSTALAPSKLAFHSWPYLPTFPHSPNPLFRHSNGVYSGIHTPAQTIFRNALFLNSDAVLFYLQGATKTNITSPVRPLSDIPGKGTYSSSLFPQ